VAATLHTDLHYLLSIFVLMGSLFEQPQTQIVCGSVTVTDPSHLSYRGLIAEQGLNVETIVIGMENDHDIPGRFDSWMDLTEKLTIMHLSISPGWNASRPLLVQQLHILQRPSRLGTSGS